MKFPKRFALSTLLLVMLIVSLVFGYAQWRRQWLISEVGELNKLGEVKFAAPNQRAIHTRMFPELLVGDGIWPKAHPGVVKVLGIKNESGQFEFGGKVFGKDEAKTYLTAIERRLLSIGALQMNVLVMEQKGGGYLVRSFGAVDSIE